MRQFARCGGGSRGLASRGLDSRPERDERRPAHTRLQLLRLEVHDRQRRGAHATQGWKCGGQYDSLTCSRKGAFGVGASLEVTFSTTHCYPGNHRFQLFYFTSDVGSLNGHSFDSHFGGPGGACTPKGNLHIGTVKIELSERLKRLAKELRPQMMAALNDQERARRAAAGPAARRRQRDRRGARVRREDQGTPEAGRGHEDLHQGDRQGAARLGEQGRGTGSRLARPAHTRSSSEASSGRCGARRRRPIHCAASGSTGSGR